MTKILIVDDTPDMAVLIRRVLEKQGYETFVANDGRQALEIAVAQRPDVILLDIMMPGMDGLEVLERLKSDADLRDVPVILVTAKGEDDDVVKGLDSGALDYVTKPFKREVLAARVRSAVRIVDGQHRLQHINTQLAEEIVERRRMEAELAHSQKLEAMGHLAAGIAHEINTPAQYVGDNTRFLQDAFVSLERLIRDLIRLVDCARRDEISDELIAEIENRARSEEINYILEETPKAIQQSIDGLDQVSRIVLAMKEYSHPGNGRKQSIDLNRAIENALVVSRNEWKYVADAVTEFDAALPTVECLPGDIGQVIMNLIVNAAHAISQAIGGGEGKRGRITVRTRHDGDWAEIQVADTGCGIPEEIHHRIFDHFFTTKEVGQGSGQGLAIARAVVVQKHGGKIWFESEVGMGSTFFVRLPLRAESATISLSDRSVPN